ncbi:hypothetical protein BDR05DRAFT_972738 [Suillus weaverae]|nr:hypothetical protein BDR05DRAFT_972738 [Suillus weaverae]
MQGHTGRVSVQAFFKDSRHIVTSSYDCTIQIWDVEKGESVGVPFKGHCDWVQTVCISPDEAQTASGGAHNNTIIIWDIESNQKVLHLKKHTAGIWAVCFSPNGMKLASGSGDTAVIIWDAKTGTMLQTFKGHGGHVYTVAFSPDGLKLASVTQRMIWICHTDNAEELLKIKAYEFQNTTVGKTIRFWNSSNGDPIGQPCIGHTHELTSLALSSGGSFVATSSLDSTVWLWSTKTYKQIGQSLEHGAWVHSVAISPNEELVVSGGDDRVIWLWSIKNILEQHDAEERLLEDKQLQLLFGNDMQLPVMVCSHDNNINNDELTGDQHSLFNIFSINTIVPNAFIGESLHPDEELPPTQETNDTGDNNHDSYANHSIVRARNSKWDNALQDAVKSIAIQPSLLGYISKGIALCGNKQLYDAMEAFDLTFIFLNHDPITIDSLLLIKAVALFNAVQELAATYQHSDTLPCSIVNVSLISDLTSFLTLERTHQSYLCIQLAIIAFDTGCITNLFSRGALLEPRLKIFMVLLGWDLDSVWQTVNQRRCEAFLRADQVFEAVESHQYMMCCTIEEVTNPSCLKWSTTFKQDCTACCVAKGDATAATSNYEMAIELYSAAITLDPSCHTPFAQHSKAKFAQDLYTEALHDAEKVVELNPLSYVGYELKHEALQGAQCYGKAVQAFKIMLSKLDDSQDTQMQELCQQYAQIHTFTTSDEYQELLYSLMVCAHLQTGPIQQAVEMYFCWVMLSHRWESKELLLHDIQDKAIYGLDPVGTIVKLQAFCKTACEAGYCWAWSDTCCINQNNNVELQESVNSMFIWYCLSALTIIYLLDEFLAPNIVLFYQADWTLYLNDRSSNHKESVAIMQELEHSTGINKQTLKLQWASSCITTLQEDIAYSLFGIFRVHLPVIYGKKKQNALGRLLQEIIAHSGDISALDWVRKSSEFNSFSTLQNVITVESALKLYTILDNLNTPHFATSRLQLPCITFPVIEVRRRHGQGQESTFTYDVKADNKLIQFSWARPTQQTFLLICPWNHQDLGLPDFADDMESMDKSVLESPLVDSFGDFPGENESLRLIVRLGQPFGTIFLAQQHGGEYKRITSDHDIMAWVKDIASIHDIRTLEIL